MSTINIDFTEREAQMLMALVGHVSITLNPDVEDIYDKFYDAGVEMHKFELSTPAGSPCPTIFLKEF